MEENTKREIQEKGNELKNETINIVKDVKETVKNINFKEETKKGKGYLKELVENPVSKMKSIVKDKDNTYFKTAICAVILWTAVVLIDVLFMYEFSFSYFFEDILRVLKTIVAPVASVLVLSLVILVLNKENKKSLNCVITTVVTAKIPVILGEVIGLLSIISSSATKITSPIASVLNLLSTVLLFFGIKNLFEIDEDNQGVKKFVLVMAAYHLARFFITFLGIYL